MEHPDKENAEFEKAQDAVSEIIMEYNRASQAFGPMRSPHEGIAIIREEFEELWDEILVFTIIAVILEAVGKLQHDVRTKEKMRHEAKQLAAMALRFMVDRT
jgi:hypothetical protein